MHNNDDVVFLTPGGYKKLNDELTHLTTVRRHEIANRIREANEHGEFADDNTEFDEIKFEQALVEKRIAELKEVLGQAQKLTAKDIPTDAVGMGSVVTLKSMEKKGDTFDVRLVTPYEADPDEGFVSTESPMGQALLTRKKGDKISINVPAGLLKYEIVEIAKK